MHLMHLSIDSFIDLPNTFQAPTVHRHHARHWGTARKPPGDLKRWKTQTDKPLCTDQFELLVLNRKVVQHPGWEDGRGARATQQS